MDQPGVERRRTPRADVRGPQNLTLDLSIPVQVVDISLSGVLLASKVEIPLGEQGHLMTAVGARSLSLGIEVRRISVDERARTGLRFRAGAAFIPMSAEQRLALEQLLGVERS